MRDLLKIVRIDVLELPTHLHVAHWICESRLQRLRSICANAALLPGVRLAIWRAVEEEATCGGTFIGVSGVPSALLFEARLVSLDVRVGQMIVSTLWSLLMQCLACREVTKAAIKWQQWLRTVAVLGEDFEPLMLLMSETVKRVEDAQLHGSVVIRHLSSDLHRHL